MSDLNKPGQIITFYSYKGGVGRSMAVANVGTLLASRAHSRGNSVLLIDWDLEAPGLERYFAPLGLAPENPGLIDYILELRRSLDSNGTAPSLEPYTLTSTGFPGLHLLKAGRIDDGYPRKVAEFDWVGLLAASGDQLRRLRMMLANNYEYVLIDSRTGISDVSGLCTSVLPDKLVALFAPNDQNLHGLKKTLRSILRHRRSSLEERPLTIIPVPSRFDTTDLPRMQDYLVRFLDAFAELFAEQYALTSVDLRRHFNYCLLPYFAMYSYGERIVISSEEPDFPGSLRAAYSRLAAAILRDVPWEYPEMPDDLS